MKPRVFYFGCARYVGHYWWRPGGVDSEGSPCHPRTPSREELDELLREGDVDGKLVPVNRTDERDQPEGRALLHVRDRWTLLAFWDRSVDGRHGSNSVFAIEGVHDFASAVEAARAAFPTVWVRFSFPVVDHFEAKR